MLPFRRWDLVSQYFMMQYSAASSQPRRMNLDICQTCARIMAEWRRDVGGETQERVGRGQGPTDYKGRVSLVTVALPRWGFETRHRTLQRVGPCAAEGGGLSNFNKR